jgi:hypothetical protein
MARIRLSVFIIQYQFINWFESPPLFYFFETPSVIRDEASSSVVDRTGERPARGQ